MASDIDPLTLSPDDFEAYVETWFRSAATGISNCEVSRREVLMGTDGNYDIDVVARFEAAELAFTVLIECKRHSNPIKRDVIQTLHSKMRSVGAQRGQS
ncbi:MAG TPA: restriction endonuclease [Gemmatimonadaceae bacterium]|nr:restriction endonuclease [Gemmatimonadaceae bacterium]